MSPPRRVAELASPLMSRTRAIISSLAALGIACTQPATTPRMDPTVTSVASEIQSDSPFAAPSTLPFQAPAFDKITDADYQPAIEEGMRQQLAEIEAIASQSATRRRSTTRSWRWSARARCSRACRDGVQRARQREHRTTRSRKCRRTMAPKLAAHSDAIYLNRQAVRARQERSTTGARRSASTPSRRMLVERYHRELRPRRRAAVRGRQDASFARSTRKRRSSPPSSRTSCSPQRRPARWWSTTRPSSTG